MLDLCPSCHRKIYVPGALAGSHSILKRDSLVILGSLASTSGKAYVFRKTEDGSLLVYCLGSQGVVDFGDLTSFFPEPKEVKGQDELGSFIGKV